MEFPTIVVLNLKRRPDRWAAWVKEAERVGISNYNRWEAIDGGTLHFTTEIEYLFRDNDFNMRKNVVGCALSHMNIWLHVVENKIPSLIVFEDDARFNEPFTVPELPSGWDLFYFGGPPFKGIYPPGVPISDRIIIPRLPEDLYFTAIGYMISYKGAHQLLERLVKVGFNRAVDWFMRDSFNKLNVFCYRKLILYPDENAGSDIQGKDKGLPG